MPCYFSQYPSDPDQPFDSDKLLFTTGYDTTVDGSQAPRSRCYPANFSYRLAACVPGTGVPTDWVVNIPEDAVKSYPPSLDGSARSMAPYETGRFRRFLYQKEGTDELIMVTIDREGYVFNAGVSSRRLTLSEAKSVAVSDPFIPMPVQAAEESLTDSTETIPTKRKRSGR